MIATDLNQGSRAAYEYWLGLISQLFGQLGVPSSTGAAPADSDHLPFPVDQVAKAVSITQQSLQSMLQVLVPTLQTGMPNLVAQWGEAIGHIFVHQARRHHRCERPVNVRAVAGVHAEPSRCHACDVVCHADH